MQNFTVISKLFVNDFELGIKDTIKVIMSDDQVLIGDIEGINGDYLAIKNQWIPNAINLKYKDINKLILIEYQTHTDENEYSNDELEA